MAVLLQEIKGLHWSRVWVRGERNSFQIRGEQGRKGVAVNRGVCKRRGGGQLGFLHVCGNACSLLGPAFGRTDFSRIFIFEPPDFFADFLAGFFLLIFVGKSAEKNPPGKSPGKSSKIYTTKNPPPHFCRLARAIIRLKHGVLHFRNRPSGAQIWANKRLNRQTRSQQANIVAYPHIA